jgi:hypothetical protein
VFDPFFAIAFVSAPFATMFLIAEARRNADAIPTLGVCLVALLAAVGVADWIMAIMVALFGRWMEDSAFQLVQWFSFAVGFAAVGSPFLRSVRQRRQRAGRSADQS